MRRAVVTGGSGGLGAALVRALMASGVEVAGVGRSPHGPPGLARWIAADIASLDWSELADWADVVFHLAAFVHRAPLPEELRLVDEVNHGATARLAAALGAREKRLVFASTVAVYGPGAEGLNEDAPIRPTTAYGESKAKAEDAIRQTQGLRHAILRFPLLYGPGGRGNLERLLRAMARHRYLPIGDPTTKKTLLHLDDAARALILAATAADGTYVVAPPNPVTLREIHAAAYAALGMKVPRFWVPTAAAHGAGSLVDRAAASLGRTTRLAERIATLTSPAWYDGARFAAVTGFTPEVQLRAGMTQTADWIRLHAADGAAMSWRSTRRR